MSVVERGNEHVVGFVQMRVLDRNGLAGIADVKAETTIVDRERYAAQGEGKRWAGMQA